MPCLSTLRQVEQTLYCCYGIDIDAACLSLCSAIQCLRGSQSSIGSFGHPILVTSVELFQAETAS